MTWLIYILAVVLVFGTFTFLAVPNGRWKVAAVLTFIAMTGTVFAGSFELLGKPKPISLEFRDLKGSTILAYTFVEGTAIYLWLDRNGQPMTFVLPWSTEDAQDIQDAVEGAGKIGGTAQLGAKIDGIPDAPDNGEIANVVPPTPPAPKG